MDGESPSPSKRQYFCDQCSYCTTYPSNLRRHKQVHGSTAERVALSNISNCIVNLIEVKVLYP